MPSANHNHNDVPYTPSSRSSRDGGIIVDDEDNNNAQRVDTMTLASIPVPQPSNDNDDDHDDDMEDDDDVPRKARPPPAGIGPSVIGSTRDPVTYCPCCQQSRHAASRHAKQRIGDVCPPIKTTTTSLLDEDADEEEEEELLGLDLDEDERRSASPSPPSYTPTRVLAEGWLHKKGTGRDWMGSRSWKARWGRLVMARLHDGDEEVPMLLLQWYPSSATANTALALDRTVVVVAVDVPTHAHARHRWEIRSVRDGAVTRTLAAATRKQRDEWIHAVARTLLSHAKDRAVYNTNNNNNRRSTVVTTTTAIRPTSPPPRPSSPPPPSLPKSPRSRHGRSTVTAPHTYDF